MEMYTLLHKVPTLAIDCISTTALWCGFPFALSIMWTNCQFNPLNLAKDEFSHLLLNVKLRNAAVG